MTILRHAFAILALPFMVVVVVPAWLVRRAAAPPSWPISAVEWLVSGAGIALLAAGTALFALCLGLFGAKGRGTLAPWDPPTRLVVEGPYAHVRNPMITAVVLMLLAEGLVLRSMSHLAWAGAFALFNAVYLPLLEEPELRRRFGGEYDDYARHVPRLIPRVTPWRKNPAPPNG